MKEEGEDPETGTDCLLLDSVQGDCFSIRAVPSGTMEGKEMPPSHNSEESTVLDLPFVCDLAECFLPSHSSENSEELFLSVDTFPSPPTGASWQVNGKTEIIQSVRTSELPFSNEYHQPNHLVGTTEAPREIQPLLQVTRSMINKMADRHQGLNSSEMVLAVLVKCGCSGESNLPSAVPVSFSAGGSEKANVRCYPKAGLCEPTEPSDAALSWMYERDSAEDTSIRKSLDGFYKMYCKKWPDRMDPTYEAASRCLSQKISELANRDGKKYALRCLQMAQVVLNRDGCKIFPNHPTNACFSKPAEEVALEDRKRTPGLSDDVLQFLLKQTQTERSPDVSHEK